MSIKSKYFGDQEVRRQECDCACCGRHQRDGGCHQTQWHFKNMLWDVSLCDNYDVPDTHNLKNRKINVYMTWCIILRKAFAVMKETMCEVERVE